MVTLQVLEHQKLPIVRSRGAHETVLTERDAAVLERLMPKLPRGACCWEHRAVRFSQHCGVICLGNTVIEVLPKIAGKELDAGSCRDVLIGMLSESRLIEPTTAATGPMRLQRTVLLDAFVLAFCRELEVQVAQGLVRQYVDRLDNIPVVRGKLRLELLFKENVVRKERMYCEYDELSADILLNRAIKGVLRKLTRFPLGLRAAKYVRELSLRFDAVSDVIATPGMLDDIALDRTMTRYASIVEQCRWFLHGIYPDVTTGDSEAAALLFDMNKLFEVCVTHAARREAWRRGLRVHAQGPRKWFARDVAGARDIFAMKPDITITDAERVVLVVADAKWKLLDENDGKFGVTEADMYQMAAYASRYGAARATLIYPRQLGFTRRRELRTYTPQAVIELVPFDVVNRSCNSIL